MFFGLLEPVLKHAILYAFANLTSVVKCDSWRKLADIFNSLETSWLEAC